MAKRSNKTEHVMKLITKDATDMEGKTAGGQQTDKTAEADADAEITVKEPDQQELSYKTKLKIEIEPEIQIKGSDKEPESAAAKVDVPAEDSGVDAAETPIGRTGDRPEAETAKSQPEEREPEEDATPPEPEIAAPEPEEVQNPKEPGAAGEASMSEAKRIAMKDADRRTRMIQIESALMDENKHLVNLAELVTKELLPSVMERMGVCTCSTCTTNVLALALNALPARYVTSDVGKQYSRLEVYKKQYEMDVLAALTKACIRVKTSPRHEKEE